MNILLLRGIALCAALAVARPVGAQTAPPAASPFGADASIGEAALGKIAGREDLNQIAQAHQVGSVSDSSVNGNSITGDLKIADQAFQNMNGLTILNANTGNNVAINAAMSVNIAISSQP